MATRSLITSLAQTFLTVLLLGLALPAGTPGQNHEPGNDLASEVKRLMGSDVNALTYSPLTRMSLGAITSVGLPLNEYYAALLLGTPGMAIASLKGPEALLVNPAVTVSKELIKICLEHPSRAARGLANQVFKQGYEAYKQNYALRRRYVADPDWKPSAEEARQFLINEQKGAMMNAARNLISNINSQEHREFNIKRQAAIEAMSRIEDLLDSHGGVVAANIADQINRIIIEKDLGLDNYPPFVQYQQEVTELSEAWATYGDDIGFSDGPLLELAIARRNAEEEGTADDSKTEQVSLLSPDPNPTMDESNNDTNKGEAEQEAPIPPETAVTNGDSKYTEEEDVFDPEEFQKTVELVKEHFGYVVDEIGGSIELLDSGLSRTEQNERRVSDHLRPGGVPSAMNDPKIGSQAQQRQQREQLSDLFNMFAGLLGEWAALLQRAMALGSASLDAIARGDDPSQFNGQWNDLRGDAIDLLGRSRSQYETYYGQ